MTVCDLLDDSPGVFPRQSPGRVGVHHPGRQQSSAPAVGPGPAPHRCGLKPPLASGSLRLATQAPSSSRPAAPLPSQAFTCPLLLTRAMRSGGPPKIQGSPCPRSCAHPPAEAGSGPWRPGRLPAGGAEPMSTWLCRVEPVAALTGQTVPSPASPASASAFSSPVAAC